MLAIRNLINRQAFTISDRQVQLLHTKFKNLSNYRLNRSPDGLDRALSEKGNDRRMDGYGDTPPMQEPYIEVMNPKNIREPKKNDFTPKTFGSRKFSSPNIHGGKSAGDPFNRAYLGNRQPPNAYQQPRQ